jgi:myo-inositol 2-dehydrogenase/D-chiro-inositol 1-dehydrogenase
MNQPDYTRRDFIKTSSAVAVTGAVATNLLIPTRSFAQNAETIKIGLVGCGGRGSGAAKNALTVDKNVILVAMGDVFPDAVERSLKNLQAQADVGTQVQVTKENCFSGFDAYKKVIDAGVDLVILATPPGFRPYHIKYAVQQGKHVFCEKPVCTDAPGYRSFLETVAEAKKKKLGIASGFCWRSNMAERAIYEKILGGEIGDIRSLYGTYNTGEPRGIRVEEGWSPMETQLRNWMHFTWLSGDHLLEQAVHNVDLTAWAMGDKMPKKCVAHGGRQVRPDKMFGHIFDHFSVVYEFDKDVRGFLFCRQQSGCFSENLQRVYGSKATAHVMLAVAQPFITDLEGKRIWKYEGDKSKPNMYDVEHDEFLKSIRAGTPRNDGEQLAHSSMMGLMGRMAGYTGQQITWEEAVNSQEKLVPDEVDITWEKAPAVPPLAVPGQTKFI